MLSDEQVLRIGVASAVDSLTEAWRAVHAGRLAGARRMVREADRRAASAERLAAALVVGWGGVRGGGVR